MEVRYLLQAPESFTHGSNQTRRCTTGTAICSKQ